MTMQPVQDPALPGTRGRTPAPSRKIQDRYTPPIASSGFTPVPSIFLEWYAGFAPRPGQRGINSTDAMLLIHLMSFKWDRRDPFPKLALLAQRMGMEKRSVRAALRRLETLGVLKRTRRLNASVNQFDLTGLFEMLDAVMVARGAPTIERPPHAKPVTLVRTPVKP